MVIYTTRSPRAGSHDKRCLGLEDEQQSTSRANEPAVVFRVCGQLADSLLHNTVVRFQFAGVPEPIVMQDTVGSHRLKWP
jgi:hypothetical protein